LKGIEFQEFQRHSEIPEEAKKRLWKECCYGFVAEGRRNVEFGGRNGAGCSVWFIYISSSGSNK
jgi:hypothetical protein